MLRDSLKTLSAAVHELEPLVVNDTVDAGTTHEK